MIIPSNMMKDLLTAVHMGKTKKATSRDSGSDYSAMRVSDLRRALNKKGLDVDGSRETMIALLKEKS